MQPVINFLDLGEKILNLDAVKVVVVRDELTEVVFLDGREMEFTGREAKTLVNYLRANRLNNPE